MSYSPETAEKLAEWREKAKEGILTQEEMKEAILLMRQGRYSACFASKTALAKKAVEELPTAEQLIDELMKSDGDTTEREQHENNIICS